ncbi:MAG: pyruvate kinase, partial [Olpidium bornovanus]
MPTAAVKPIASQDVASRLEWCSKLDVHVTPKALRKCSIICTIGPKTASVEMISALRDAGMNILRMNFSHGSYEYHGSVVKNARASTAKNGRVLAIALDTKGPEIRTGMTANDEDIDIPAGHEMRFSTDEKYANAGTKEVIYIDYQNLPKR